MTFNILFKIQIFFILSTHFSFSKGISKYLGYLCVYILFSVLLLYCISVFSSLNIKGWIYIRDTYSWRAYKSNPQSNAKKMRILSVSVDVARYPPNVSNFETI